MAKYSGPVCRLCRREGEKLFLKGSRCMTEKCAIERRSYPPGQHGQARQRTSDYSLQLREKQKLKWAEVAARMPGRTVASVSGRYNRMKLAEGNPI